MTSWYHYLVWKFLQSTMAKSIMKKYNLEVKGDFQEPSPPFLFMGNHAHLSDPFFIGKNIKHPINFMANVDSVSLLKKIGTHLVGIFPKKKGVPDLNAVKKMFALLKKGRVVGIFPEGDRCWDGETARILDNIPSLVKMARVPVVMGRLTGNYLSGPRWAGTYRQGKIFLEFTTLSPEEIKSLSKIELHKRISDFLHKDDIKDAGMQENSFRGEKLAEGIQFLLWFCPSCRANDSITGEGDTILCRQCGAQWSLDGNLRIKPDNIAGRDLKDWSSLQNEEIKRLCGLNKDTLLIRSSDIVFNEKQGKKVIYYDKGSLELYQDKIIFNAFTKNNLVFETPKVLYYVDNFNKNFQFSHENKRYQIDFNGKNASKWIFFLDYLHHAENGD